MPSTSRVGDHADQIPADLVVVFDRGQLNQIVWNLVRNALAALPQRPSAASGSRPAPATWATRSSARCRRRPGHPGGPARPDLRAVLHDAAGRHRPRACTSRASSPTPTARRSTCCRRPGRALPHDAAAKRQRGRPTLPAPNDRPEPPRRIRHVTQVRAQPKVLIVDDEPDLLELLELTLSRMGLDTVRADSVGEAIAPARQRALRPVPHRHAPARRRGPAHHRAHQQQGARRAGRGDHRLRQRRPTRSRRSRPAPSTTCRSRWRWSSCARWSSRR